MDNKWTQEQIFNENDSNKQYAIVYKFKKSKIKINGTKSKWFGFIFTIFLILIVLLLINLFKTYSTSNNANVYSVKSSVYYGVSIASFSANNEAVTMSKKVQNLGGAGYVYNTDNKFKVLTSLYTIESDAQNVVNKLKEQNYNEAEIINIYTPNINIEIPNNLPNIFGEAIAVLVPASISLDKNEITLTTVKHLALNLFNEYDTQYNNVKTNLNSSFKMAVEKTLNSLKNLSDIAIVNNNSIYQIKYEIIEIALAQKNM